MNKFLSLLKLIGFEKADYNSFIRTYKNYDNGDSYQIYIYCENYYTKKYSITIQIHNNEYTNRNNTKNFTEIQKCIDYLNEGEELRVIIRKNKIKNILK